MTGLGKVDKVITNKGGHTVKMHNLTYSDGAKYRVAEEYDKNGKYLKQTTFFGKGTSSTTIAKDGKEYWSENNKVNVMTDKQKGIMVFYSGGVKNDTVSLSQREALIKAGD